MWLVNEVVMLLVDCQLSLVVIGCEDCTQWLVRFDPSFVSLMSVRVWLVKLVGLLFVCCKQWLVRFDPCVVVGQSVVYVVDKSFVRCGKL